MKSKKNQTTKTYEPNYSHAWRGSWDRPMLVDENTLHPFTVARMTNHNVRGTDKPATKGRSNRGGIYSYFFHYLK
ncbi:MAG: hypothetical protein A4S09_16585 [Proteobacteria bacterium SG_bin7]|nr:MAG: hypothetical protein A4S09_16585 [Proteobacteria bacterium SG_bin7]